MRTALLPLATLPLLLTACLGGGGGDAAPTATNTTTPDSSQTVSVRFAMKAGNQNVTCQSTLTQLGTSNSNATVADARFYISKVNLIDSQGKATELKLDQNQWQYLNTALLDFEDGTGGTQGCGYGTPSMNKVVTGKVPAGTYTGIQFEMGVPVSALDSEGKTVSLNHSSYDVAPAPLNLAGMSWSWQAGRRFSRIELVPQGGITRPAVGNPGDANYKAASTLTFWMLHMGSTGCSGNPVNGESVSCTNSNRATIKLPAFNPATQQVVLDLAKLFSETDLSKDLGGSSGCMAGTTDPECAAIFKQFDLNLTESAPGHGDAGKSKGDGSNQNLFRVEAL